MTTVKGLGQGPGWSLWAAQVADYKSKWYNQGWASDLIGAAGWTISGIIGRPRKPRTVEEFMKGDVAGPVPFGSSLPLILTGGVALILILALFKR